jgi:hypothetical protein
MRAMNHHRTPIANARRPPKNATVPMFAVVEEGPSKLKPPALHRPMPSRIDAAATAINLAGALNHDFFFGCSMKVSPLITKRFQSGPELWVARIMQPATIPIAEPTSIPVPAVNFHEYLTSPGTDPHSPKPNTIPTADAAITLQPVLMRIGVSRFGVSIRRLRVRPIQQGMSTGSHPIPRHGAGA